ncbi:DUF1080 domain-containing protein [Mucilaginibacter sp. UR6-11]|uniref:3-keto-disaccharide hydrolase n=1 Tax=Mucilaginibacter sp. UR6-11 TaxID=1435644 RepID=UPI001E614322|nr:DUF1080 domain-containing protein [Mucilaginibacter sp. UR6-11]MCC8426857.1 DUF1080 domain-containing protein [Mucilaginibacter sp. UR6-11]
MRFIKFLFSAISFMLILGFVPFKQKTQWQSLFNGKDLSGWDSYIGPDQDDKGNPINNIPIGLNNDPRHVFSIVKVDGENVIRVSGENWGAIATNKEFENYHLQLQYKWGTLTWGQKRGRNKDSGLLYHSTGQYGADYGAWMRSHEFQIEQTNSGEYWGVAGGMADIPAYKKTDGNFEYNPSGTMYTFAEESPQGRHCMKRGADAENPTGEWNTLDLYCHGDTSIHMINGKVMMVLYHLKQSDKGHNLSALTKGKIQLQSEGAEILYRHVKIQGINKLPAELL